MKFFKKLLVSSLVALTAVTSLNLIPIKAQEQDPKDWNEDYFIENYKDIMNDYNGSFSYEFQTADGPMFMATGNSIQELSKQPIDGQAIANKARSYVGKLGYKLGAKYINGSAIDCSGFVTWIYRNYLGTMWLGNTQGGYGYQNSGSYRGNKNHYTECNNGSGYYVMGAWDHVTGHLYMDTYGIGSNNLMDVCAWEHLLRYGKSNSYINGPVESSALTKTGTEVSGGFDSFNPGDIVIFYEKGGTSYGNPYNEGSHIGVYVGNGRVVHSSLATKGVAEQNLLDIKTSSENVGVYAYRIYRVTPKQEKKGTLQIKKSSAIPSITDGNNYYSLEGAEYGVYKNSNATGLVGTLKIKSDGWSNVIELNAGTYYVKETKAPKGYVLNPEIKSVVVITGQATVESSGKFKDLPKSDPVRFVVRKVDADTGKPIPTGKGTLKDAQFTVKFYEGSYDVDPATKGKSPKRTWVLKTDEDGDCFLNDEFKVSGDSLYYNSKGVPTLPLGTITVQETKAPKGYHIDSSVHVRKILEKGNQEAVETYNVPIVKENVVKLTLKKYQKDKVTSISGVKFEHVMPDGTKETVTTNTQGVLVIEGLHTGKHTLKEVYVKPGYDIRPETIEFDVAANGKVTMISNKVPGIVFQNDQIGNGIVEIEDSITDSHLQIIKVNQYGKLLDGAEFTLYEDKECKKALETKQTIDGKLVFDYGVKDRVHYFLKETKAPKGYRIPVDQYGNVHVYDVYTEATPEKGVFNFVIDGVSYNVNSTTGDIHLEGDSSNHVVSIQVVNQTGMRLPETGSSKTLVILFVGAILSVLGFSQFKKQKKERKF